LVGSLATYDSLPAKHLSYRGLMSDHLLTQISVTTSELVTAKNDVDIALPSLLSLSPAITRQF